MNTTTKWNGIVALATVDQDLGVVPSDTARAIAQEHADQLGEPVTLRDPVTDKLLATVKPRGHR